MCFLEQFPDYCKQVSEIRKIISCKIFPPFVIIFRYFVLFLDISFLKGKDCSCFNNNFRLNLMKVKKKKKRIKILQLYYFIYEIQ